MPILSTNTPALATTPMSSIEQPAQRTAVSAGFLDRTPHQYPSGADTTVSAVRRGEERLGDPASRARGRPSPTPVLYLLRALATTNAPATIKSRTMAMIQKGGDPCPAPLSALTLKPARKMLSVPRPNAV
ncbi:hypothetical protein [Streptomyces sp. NPDC001919]